MLTMVRFPRIFRSSKKNVEKDDRIWHLKGGIDGVKPPDGRLWLDMGYFETFWEETGYLDGPSRDAKAAGRQIRYPFHDPMRCAFIFDIFERDWGTEVLAYVREADWDDIKVTTF